MKSKTLKRISSSIRLPKMLTTRRKFPLIEGSCRRGAAVRLDEIRRSTDVREIWPELENVRQVRVLSKCLKLIVEGEERRNVRRWWWCRFFRADVPVPGIRRRRWCRCLVIEKVTVEPEVVAVKRRSLEGALLDPSKLSKVSLVRCDAKSGRMKSRSPPIEIRIESLVSCHRACLLCVGFVLRRYSSLSPRVLCLYPGGRSHSVLLRRCSSSSPRDLCLYPGGRSHSVLLRRCSRKSPSAGGFGAESFSLSIVSIFPRPVALGRLRS